MAERKGEMERQLFHPMIIPYILASARAGQC